MKRYIALTMFCVISLFALSIAFVSSADGNVPVMYRNDTKYSIAEYPVEIIDGKVHVPINFFIGLSGIQYVHASDPAGFYIRNTNTGRYLSFSANSDSIIVDSELVNVNFPIVNATVYLPLEYCAEVLSLSLEKKSDEKAQRIRMTDGTQKLTFEELVELYDPTVKPPENPVITPEKPTEQNPPEEVTPPISEQTQRYVYITIDVKGKADASAAIDELRSSGIKATFFFDYDSIASHPKAVIKAFAEGHEIGIYMDKTSEAKKTNEILYTVLNFNTRLYKTGEQITENEISGMSKKGYIYRKNDITSDTLDTKNPKQAARDLYNGIFKKEHTVIGITMTENTVEILRRLTDYINGDDNAEMMAIDLTADI